MKQTVISPVKANSLYWLGRYTERIYLELHLLRRCFDMMIDGRPSEYNNYLTAIGNSVTYPDLATQRDGLVHDKYNPVSVLSCVERANDNAVLLRDEITSATLSYVQMSLETLRRNAEKSVEPNVDELQTLTDWMLAFWGSVEERVYDERIRVLLKIGKLVEHMDMNIRFSYKFYRIEEAFESLMRCFKEEPRAFDAESIEALKYLLKEDDYNPKDPVYVNKVLYLLGNVVTL